uniref:Uncharacterized protein n=1 Tax=Anguilla anguilla TaxID=7936 RepID=A0A0E9VK79_ANGAN
MTADRRRASSHIREGVLRFVIHLRVHRQSGWHAAQWPLSPRRMPFLTDLTGRASHEFRHFP